MQTIPNPIEAQSFFFEAMLHGWANEGSYVDQLPFPGFKTFPFSRGNWYLADIYHTTPKSEKSSGMTTIFYNGIPVWVMHYGGGYDKLAIPTLKKALCFNYNNRDFVGGRGPIRFEDGRYLYENDPRGSGELFEGFEGVEYIEDTVEHTLLGQHWYRGCWLLD